ncbi:uncharacterized protein LOC123709901 isoform X2 [Pieris brassicae]|uniref:uncharacterized protein LOC123709901 isoform X2 n=1 Tax=Pieris brassicae TaxID=7116 RepID=UPI001E65EE31|nr:uncharacterized protein LOC123709901 isoform X2 [Pieris brassicae]
MGCTSSAPVMTDAQSDATDGAKSETNNEHYSIEEKVQNTDVNHKNHLSLNSHYSSDMLPKSDKINENLQLPSYNSIFLNNDSDWSAKGIDNCINSDSQKNIVQTEKKLKTFIEVVDQVLVNNVVEDEKLEESQEADAARNDPEPENVSTKEEIIPANNKTPEIVNENIEEKDDVKNILEHESPTQSESRSTRWEALADIAAELPPSLAVDPVTGQIYSLTK